MANMVAEHMEWYHTKFIRGATPISLEKPDPEGQIKVTWKSDDGTVSTGDYDTVLFAIGRYAVTQGLNLAAAGVVAESNGKFNVNEFESTNVSHIYAIGDVQNGKLELTPTAIKAGMLLAERLYAGKTELMDYVNVPTTVFTPLEYGSCGYSEEDAKKKFGDENISTYHTKFKPLEWQYDKIAAEGMRTAYTKVLVNKADSNRVVGFHICSPSAGEITQGVGIGFKCGMTKEQLDSVVGIHPTVAEEVIGLKYTKEDNPDASKSGC